MLELVKKVRLRSYLYVNPVFHLLKKYFKANEFDVSFKKKSCEFYLPRDITIICWENNKIEIKQYGKTSQIKRLVEINKILKSFRRKK